MNIIKELSGYSGCKVFLCEDDNIFFVRKISGSTDYNKRLISQKDKQKFMHASGFSVPKVFKDGYDKEN